MGKALYRKYRSKKLSEIIGQEHITTTLENALKKNLISHAYLFTGPRGVGKTSIARILAYEVNGFKYDETQTHLDIIEIDAASNRRIDEIRDLREHIHSAPNEGKYKVYIIDEVHMLTKEAFNALLKTLEEPPSHVIFILATTEAHKLPDTIISRTQRFTFRPVERDKAVAHLASIAKQEGVNVDEEALDLIAAHGEGSFRDSISLLDQVSTGRTDVSVGDVRNTLGIAPDAVIESIITALEVGSAQVIIQTIDDMRAAGYHTPQLAKQLSARLRQQLLENSGQLPNDQIAHILERLIDVPSSHDPDALFELILLGQLQARPKTKAVSENSPPKLTVEATGKPTPKSKIQTPPPTPEPEPAPKEQESKPKPDSSDVPETVELTKKQVILDEATWQEALNALKQKYNTLYGIARMASPTFTDNTVTLTFQFPFHQKRLDDTKNKKVLAGILSELMETDVAVVCLVDKDKKNKKSQKAEPEPKEDKNDMKTISNIFGGAEVLE